MTAEDHPLLRLAAPGVRETVAERLGITPHAAPEPPPEPVDPDDVIARLRSGRGKDPRYVLDGVVVVDWDLIVREHRAAPLPDLIAAALVAREDCPPRAALALVVARSYGRRALATKTLANALRRGVVTPHQVLHEAAPGWAAMRVLEKYATTYSDDWLHPVRRVLDAAAELLPGNDLDAWLWLLKHGPRFPGTFPELCAAARTVPRPPIASRDGNGAPALFWGLSNPVGLLSRAEPAAAAKVIATLRTSVLSAFTETRRLPASVVVPALRTAPALIAALVRCADPAPDNLAKLVALRSTQVNSALLHEGPHRFTVAAAIHRATRRDNERTVPLTPHTRKALVLREDIARAHGGSAVYGHYPQLILSTFEFFGEQLGTARALRGLLSLWECRGRDAVRDAAARDRLGDEALGIAREVLDHHDGLELLREQVSRHEHPDALLAAIRRSPHLADQAFRPDFWPAAAAAHARDPLPDDALRRLGTQPDCPDTLSLQACRRFPELVPALGGRSRAHALTAVRHPVDMPAPGWDSTPRNSWYLTALTEKSLSAREFVELAYPLGAMLAVLDDVRPVLPGVPAEAVAHMRGLAARTLGDDTEMWTVAAHMFPDFVGTFPELLATVGAVTS
ncbi:MAG: hypothetical protein HOV68_29435 [Streptomycetaceae bacterium]|nr:hypothetical protein [Streptomycetaceae bacterium]